MMPRSSADSVPSTEQATQRDTVLRIGTLAQGAAAGSLAAVVGVPALCIYT
jgi:hypothetical protein